MKEVLLSLLVCVLLSCNYQVDKKEELKRATLNENKPEMNKADSVIHLSQTVHGSALIAKKNISFDFRDYKYELIRKDGKVIRKRTKTNKDGKMITDSWIENRLERKINDITTALDEEKQQLYINSINAVFYFAFLPKSLTDPAVNATIIDEVIIHAEPYYKLKVTFDEEGGGEDHDDVFLYWIHTEKGTMDYMAYQYFTEGGGMRFRKAMNPQKVQGILFQDYENYKPTNQNQQLVQLDSLFVENQLELVSVIEMKNIVVE